MGGHRGATGFRGVSRGPIAVSILVVLIALAGWVWFGVRSTVSQDTAAVAKSCPLGPRTLVVYADNSLDALPDGWAADFSAQHPMIDDYCFDARVISGGELDTAALSAQSPAPALWLARDPGQARSAAADLLADTISPAGGANCQFSIVPLRGTGVTQADHRAAKQFADLVRSASTSAQCGADS